MDIICYAKLNIGIWEEATLQTWSNKLHECFNYYNNMDVFVCVNYKLLVLLPEASRKVEKKRRRFV